MKYLQSYKTQEIKSEKVFDNFITTLRSSTKIWNYFVNWKKVNTNLKSINIELNLLNSLIGSDKLENDFIELLIKYPNVVKTLPILLAMRENNIEIIKDYVNNDLSYITFNFKGKDKISKVEAKDYFLFVKNTGLIDLFYNKKVKNFVDYVCGVEVGLDSNGRKNRTGQTMEEIVEAIIKRLVLKNKNLDYFPKATSSKIKTKWDIKVEFEKSERAFDFAIMNKATKKLFLIETNFYNGGGSKLKSVCGEFKSLFNELKTQKIELIWITDGKGWLTTTRPLEETFNNNNYVFNLSQLENGCLQEVLID